MKRFLIAFLSLNLLFVIPANAAIYNWQKKVDYGQTSWMCYKDNSLVKGWDYINGNWYYFYSNGIMAHDTIIDGYYVNSDGAWAEMPYAIQKVIDTVPYSDWAYTLQNDYEGDVGIMENQSLKEMCRLGWNAPDVYGTYVGLGIGNEYFVTNDGTVYKCPHQSYESLYEYDSYGNVVREYKYIPNKQ